MQVWQINQIHISGKSVADRPNIAWLRLLQYFFIIFYSIHLKSSKAVSFNVSNSLSSYGAHICHLDLAWSTNIYYIRHKNLILDSAT